MERPVSSEEKLLKLIRKPPAAKQAVKADEKNKKTPVDFLGLGNRLLMFSILGLVVYIAVDYFVLRPQRNEQDVSAVIPAKDVESIKSEANIEEKSFSFYQGEFERRNIFLFPWEKTDQNQAGNSQPISDLKTLIKISGILMGESPQVIVEDIKNHQTFFLSPGESVLGAAVEEIQADRVIFNFNGNTVEMVP